MKLRQRVGSSSACCGNLALIVQLLCTMRQNAKAVLVSAPTLARPAHPCCVPAHNLTLIRQRDPHPCGKTMATVSDAAERTNWSFTQVPFLHPACNQNHPRTIINILKQLARFGERHGCCGPSWPNPSPAGSMEVQPLARFYPCASRSSPTFAPATTYTALCFVCVIRELQRRGLLGEQK